MIDSRLSQVIDTAEFPVCIIARDGRLLFVNQAAAAALGKPSAELPGMSLRDLLGAGQVPALESRLEKVIDRRETKTFEDELEVAEGYRCFQSLLAPVSVPGQEFPAVLCISTDITERKLAEKELHRRVRFEELIAEISTDFLSAAVDNIEETTQQALRRLAEFTEVDRALLFELNPDESAVCCVNEWCAPGVASLRDELQNQQQAEFAWAFDLLLAGEVVAVSQLADLPEQARGERASAERFGVRSFVSVPVQFGNRFGGILSLDSVASDRHWSQEFLARLKVVANVIANSRQRLRAEKELAESRNFIEGMMAAAPNLCFVFDLEQVRHVYISPQVRELLGFDVSNILSLRERFLEEMVHPDDWGTLMHDINRSRFIPDSEVLESENRFRRADGQWRLLRSRVKVFQRGADGQVAQVIGWSEDITERKRAEEELRRRHAELARVDRVNTLGEMVTGVAHELAQPLYAVRNFLNAARNVIDQRSESKLQEAADWLRQAGHAADNAGEIIQRLRTFARNAPTERSQVSAAELIDGAVSLTKFETQRRHVRLVNEPVPEGLTLCVDRVQIQQVLVNLLQNACDAMENCPVAEREVRIGATLQRGQVQFSVSDVGEGLPSDEIDIFSPFITTKPQGLGLGLAISMTIVEEHGGELWAEQNPGRGATFQFVLPVANGESHEHRAYRVCDR